jgi:hypothetical protein
MVLWRPVGLGEMELIFESQMKTFPPRLPEQPFFYPVLSEEYATQIARDWNANETPFAGYVTRFNIPDSYVGQFPRHVVGGREHEELWVPAEDLPHFNANIEGVIAVVSAFFGRGFQGHIPRRFGLANMSATRQIQALAATWNYNKMDFHLETRANEATVYLDFPFWVASSPSELGVSADELACVFDGIRHSWGMGERTAPLIERGQIGA